MNNNAVFDKISNQAIFIAVIAILFFKVIIYFLTANHMIGLSLGGGSDANYYNAYALGHIDLAVNIWPVMLRYLNDLGLYSREIISFLLFMINLIIIPVLVSKLASINTKDYQKYYLYIYFICSIYPTLYFFSLDIYRDEFMVFVFLLGCLIVKSSLDSRNLLIKILFFLFSLLIGFLLLGLRPYLGYAFLISLFLWKIKFTKKRVLFLGFFYLVILFIANYIGALDALTEYRSGFEESSGGSTLGLSFSNPLMFVPNFILSFLGQMLGLYITNPVSVVLLLLETAPFFFMMIYVIKNISLADSFIRFLIIFFVLYASVWLIGNDNLGTAVRLRMYNYLAIYISFFYILRIKKLNIDEI